MSQTNLQEVKRKLGNRKKNLPPSATYEIRMQLIVKLYAISFLIVRDRLTIAGGYLRD
jgi:hypothetical protein